MRPTQVTGDNRVRGRAYSTRTERLDSSTCVRARVMERAEGKPFTRHRQLVPTHRGCKAGDTDGRAIQPGSAPLQPTAHL